MNLSTIKADIRKLSPRQRQQLHDWLSNYEPEKKARRLPKIRRGEAHVIPYASFDLKGYSFESFIPANEEAPHEFTVVVSKDGVTIRRETVPMMYPSLFGIDVADNAALEEHTEAIIKELGIE